MPRSDKKSWRDKVWAVMWEEQYTIPGRFQALVVLVEQAYREGASVDWDLLTRTIRAEERERCAEFVKKRCLGGPLRDTPPCGKCGYCKTSAAMRGLE